MKSTKNKIIPLSQQIKYCQNVEKKDQKSLKSNTVPLAPANIKICKTCLTTSQIDLNPCAECTHPKEICRKCQIQYIQSQIDVKGMYQNISCPQIDCNQKIDITQFQDMDAKHMKILEILQLKSYLEQLEEFRWCSNPKGCGSGQLVENFKYLKGYYCCEECQLELCFTHKVPFHFSFTCKEYDEELINNLAMGTQNYMIQNTKICPGCKNTIERSSGCSVMICCQYGTHGCQDNMKVLNKCDHGGQAFCGTMFCWQCLSIFKSGERTCKSSCKYSIQ